MQCDPHGLLPCSKTDWLTAHGPIASCLSCLCDALAKQTWVISNINSIFNCFSQHFGPNPDMGFISRLFSWNADTSGSSIPGKYFPYFVKSFSDRIFVRWCLGGISLLASVGCNPPAICSRVLHVAQRRRAIFAGISKNGLHSTFNQIAQFA